MHAQVHPSNESSHDAANDEGERESTRPIRALNRGLEVLTELNRLERAAINTLANAHLSDFRDTATRRLRRARYPR
jgi:hypothetical protein